MQNFCIRFFLCNLVLTAMIVLLMSGKRLLRRHISPRIQYRLWILMLAALFMPFFPVDLSAFSFWDKIPAGIPGSKSAALAAGTGAAAAVPEDFAVSVAAGEFSQAGSILLYLWAAGMTAMAVALFLAWRRFRRVRLSALPVENKDIQDVFASCKKELRIRRSVKLYSTPCLKAPAAAGIFIPAVYLPFHTISDFQEDDLRFMLLHELKHCQHQDGVMNLLANLAQIVYWFNPVIWHALKKMRLEREIACDSAVLEALKDEEHAGYGRTLINLAEKLSFSPFPFSSGLGDGGKQLRLRILNIAGYHRETKARKRLGRLVYILALAVFLGCAPALSIQASGDIYEFRAEDKKIVLRDLSDIFQDYDGSFVLYDDGEDLWQIHDLSAARKRSAPDSTYKIYAALHGLEEGIISSQASEMEWDGTKYPFEAWERKQDLASALRNSVNWYFQNIDSRLGIRSVRKFLREIHYGNETAGSDPEFYWTDQSLKISPVEQVELLQKLHDRQLPFSSENIETVKAALCLGKSETGALYGKTGTGQADGVNVNGWFVGWLETPGDVYYFAVNIQEGPDACGSRAAEIASEAIEEILGISLG